MVRGAAVGVAVGGAEHWAAAEVFDPPASHTHGMWQAWVDTPRGETQTYPG